MEGQSEGRPLRVLHMLWSMNQGGMETWLMYLLRSAAPDQIHMDFAVGSTAHAAYDDEIESRGSEIFRGVDWSHPWVFVKRFGQIMRDQPRYDVVHTHGSIHTGVVMWHARRAGVRGRVAHCHSDLRQLEGISRARRAYILFSSALIRRYATLGLAASAGAARSQFGRRWRSDPRFQVLHPGVDLRPFSQEVDRRSVRAALGIQPDAHVLGHVGRFAPEKNHLYLLDVAAEVFRRDESAVLVLVGGGPLQSAIEGKASSLGIRDRVVFAGTRSDVPQIMLGAFDVLLLPSLREALPVVCIEAQAAGLPCLLSDRVAHEADMVAPLVRHLALSESPSPWAEAILEAMCRPKPVSQVDALAQLTGSTFDVRTSVSKLIDLYRTSIGRP